MHAIAQISGRPWLPAMIVVAWVLSGCAQSVPVSTATSTDAADGSTGTNMAPGSAPTATKLEIQGSPANTVVAGMPYYFQPITSQGANAVTYAIVNQPAWATFSTGSGALYGVPPLNNLGTTANITITASNGATKSSIGPFHITVTESTNVPTPPGGIATLTWGRPVVNIIGNPLTAVAGYHIYYGTSATELSQKIILNGSAPTTYVLTGLTPGTYYFAVTAVTAMGTESTRSNLVRKTF